MWLQPSLLGDIGNVPSNDLLPTIQLPLTQSSNIIIRLLSLIKVALKHNFISAVITIAGGVMALHYRKIVQVGEYWY